MCTLQGTCKSTISFGERGRTWRSPSSWHLLKIFAVVSVPNDERTAINIRFGRESYLIVDKGYKLHHASMLLLSNKVRYLLIRLSFHSTSMPEQFSSKRSVHTSYLSDCSCGNYPKCFPQTGHIHSVIVKSTDMHVNISA